VDSRGEVVGQVIIDLGAMDVPRIGQQVVIQFKFIVVENLLDQLATRDLSLLGGLESLRKFRKGLPFYNLVISAL